MAWSLFSPFENKVMDCDSGLVTYLFMPKSTVVKFGFVAMFPSKARGDPELRLQYPNEVPVQLISQTVI